MPRGESYKEAAVGLTLAGSEEEDEDTP